MGLFVRESNAPSDKYGSIAYYVDDNLAAKFASIFEVPSEDEFDVIYKGDTDGIWWVYKAEGY